MSYDELLRELAMFRYLLWLRHDPQHYGALYGDDGEMQCAACMVDFKRMAAQEIVDAWHRKKEADLLSATSNGNKKP